MRAGRPRPHEKKIPRTAGFASAVMVSAAFPFASQYEIQNDGDNEPHQNITPHLPLRSLLYENASYA
jgi:hypothetical protein